MSETQWSKQMYFFYLMNAKRYFSFGVDVHSFQINYALLHTHRSYNFVRKNNMVAVIKFINSVSTAELLSEIE